MSTMSAPKTRSAKAECCADPDCRTGLRNKYFFGKQLSPSSFQVEQRYALERRRLLNRAIHGWGVVYGFELKVTPSGSLLIKPGLSLDTHGRELLHVEGLTRAPGDLIILDNAGKISDLGKLFDPRNPAPPECLLLSAHYAERDQDAARVIDPCLCEHLEWNYTCETIRFSLRGGDCAECCKGQGCEWKCTCEPAGWCDQLDSTRQRGGRHGLCAHVASVSPDSDYGRLSEINEPCGSVHVDLCNGVPLACVKLVQDECHRWAFGDVDACAPRRLVKGNDLLFDLIQGCDLTRLTEIGWKDWHRREKPVPFAEFSAAFGPRENAQGGYVTEAFWVTFSRPVRQDTLQPDCFAMSVFASEREGGWVQAFRVPIVGVDTPPESRQEGDPEGHVRSARIIVDGAWVEDGVRGRRTVFQESDTRVEIEVRGDFIIDCNGQAVDANAVGRLPSPTGNGTPGGTFLSTFQVAQAPLPGFGRTAQYNSDNRQ